MALFYSGVSEVNISFVEHPTTAEASIFMTTLVKVS